MKQRRLATCTVPYDVNISKETTNIIVCWCKGPFRSTICLDGAIFRANIILQLFRLSNRSWKRQIHCPKANKISKYIQNPLNVEEQTSEGYENKSF